MRDAAALTAESARAATADAERLKAEAAERETRGTNTGPFTFEYTVRETRQNPDDSQGLITHEKGERETLPHDVALRKQRQGLGKIVGEAA